MRRHEDRVFAMALRMLGERSDALDATQEAFIAAFRKAKSFRGESAVGTWLYRIAINACKDLARKKNRWSAQDDVNEIADRDPQQRSVDEGVTTRLHVQEALAKLPDEYREPVIMHDLGGISYEEIATATGVPVGTVKSRISRGRRRLADLLEPQTHPGPSKGQR
ncbi:MAG: sigma-70 family RNA polymerase sigma factor [Actinobacteria bacterium]|nr:sigma-70 family RNA polymerase sigma factor [Actinomycetota bacterium]